MVSDWRMGTPAPIIVEKLRVKRAIANFVISGPNTGSLSLNGSTILRTRSVFLFLRHHTVNAMPPTMRRGRSHTIAFDRTTSTIVGAGSSPPKPLNIFSNTGTMKVSMPITATTAIIKTIVG